MKIGDRVKVVRLNAIDKNSSIDIGDTGIITFVLEFRYARNIISVKFDNRVFVSDGNPNLKGDRLYQMYDDQLEVIEKDGVAPDVANGIKELRIIFDEFAKQGFTRSEAIDILGKILQNS